MNLKINKEKADIILANLDITNKKISKLVGVSEVCIERFLKRNNIIKGRRTITLDESFFEDINSNDKCYILGLIYADGWNNISGNRWGIQLTKSDEYILYDISKLLSYGGTIKNLKPSCENGKLRSRIELCSKKMCNDLLNLGVYQNKSLILDFNENLIPKQFINDFFRGVIDGDGHIYISPNYSHFSVTITSSTIFCKSCQKFFEKELNYKPSIRLYRNNNLSADLRFSGRNNVLKFLRWIYDTKSELKLNRKYDKFLSIPNSPNRNNLKYATN
jgi:hypothetical protein